MRVKVLRKFIDKNTKTLHKAGTEIEVTKKRYQEINGTSFGILVEEIREPEKNQEEESKIDDNGDGEESKPEK